MLRPIPRYNTRSRAHVKDVGSRVIDKPRNKLVNKCDARQRASSEHHQTSLPKCLRPPLCQRYPVRRAILLPAKSNRPAEHLQSKFDLGIWHSLFNWADLTVAVQNQWGGPDSSDKRDWLAGQISELFANEPSTDAEDVELMLLQVLEDEYGVRCEDETEVIVAREIMAIRKEIGEGNTETVDRLQRKWEQRKGKEVNTGSVNVEDGVQEGEWDSVAEESGEDEDGDVEMGEAPALVAARPKAEPQVDEEGFTKVVGKKQR
jgi:pre-rRNA-processing protein TSR2